MNNGAENIIVSIQCLVYNHEPYLRQCLDGFVMQKTTFKFEAIVHDDVSTDGSVAIIREYAEKFPDIIKPIYEIENQYSKRDGSLEKIMNEACRGKYIALCEGDDYWTDPLKLQKQVNFMEDNPDYSMCFGDAIYYDVKSCKDTRLNLQYKDMNLSLNISSQYETFLKIINSQSVIRTLCALYRKECLQDVEPNQYTFMMGDVPLWLDLSQRGKIYFFDEIFGVYNLHGTSIIHNRSLNKKFRLSMFEMRVYYLLKYKFEIPNIIKLRYNFSYDDYILSISLPSDKEPIFPPFNINFIYDNLSRLIRRSSLYKYLYRNDSKLITYVRHIVIKLFA